MHPVIRVKKQMYCQRPGVGASYSISDVYYSSGLRRRQQRSVASEKADDVSQEIAERFSDDNGQTWTDWQIIPGAIATQADVRLEQAGGPVCFDPASGLTVQTVFQRLTRGDASDALKALWKGDPSRLADHMFIRFSRDEGRTWSRDQLLQYEPGPLFDPDRWGNPDYFRTNRMYSGNNVTPIGGGRIATAACVTIPYDDAEDDQVTAHIPNHAGAGKVTGVIALIGCWNPSAGAYEWAASQPILLPRRISTRGLLEPSIVELSDGRLLLEMRGSNMGLDPLLCPARRWYSISRDGGKTFSPPADLLYDTAEQFYAPSSIAHLFRSSKNGKLYWIGNINARPSVSNDWRYPRYIAEVDETTPALKRNTLTIIDDYDPACDQPTLQLGFCSVREDRVTHEVELLMTRFGALAENLYSGDTYRYMLTLPA